MQSLVFPSGLSVQRAKKRAKELVRTEQAKNQTEALNSISIKDEPYRVCRRLFYLS